LETDSTKVTGNGFKPVKKMKFSKFNAENLTFKLKVKVQLSETSLYEKSTFSIRPAMFFFLKANIKVSNLANV
jgi:hypothetical protein